MKSLFKSAAFGALAAATMMAGAASASELVITFDDLNPDKKAAYDAAVEAFRAANPDIEVTANNGDREAHKSTIRSALQNDAPDVITWYPGNRMAPFVDAGLFMDISDLWASDPNLSQNFEAIKPTMSRDGKQWGVPYSYYQWGIYYRKDIFDKLDLAEPVTWDEMLAACDVMKENGVTPFTIGTQFLWPAGGMFDYLNLRTNGYEVHNALTAGEIKYTDDRIRQTFANWETLLERCSFVENHATMSWQDAIAPFANGDAAMYLMGNFAVGQFKDAGLTDEQIDFFQFPEITPGLPRAEEAPADAFFIPAKATNVENAKKFLAFVASPEVQAEWNKTIGQLPPNSSAEINTDDKFIVEGMETLSTASGLAQFYDRDAPAAMAQAGMEGFQRFMLDPSTLDEVLTELDRVQGEVY
ncbi:MAG: carbohydrate ABC transporter substrate-binding protein [Roseitalea sp.]|jgi:multiple sugar transport system substrate-binding protein|nr:carbohydrate ABC transporter substrate-binding protein [Roseitalea sp.]MBO6722155.1 carbohydrate ABC transporter substrate-binding protein [Roseitalea sp.]MBO6744917.1 carbohydrate ABC transporter substrate-binding protein [Roseitalea sp.]